MNECDWLINMKKIIVSMFVCFACSKDVEKQLPPVCTLPDTVFPETKIEVHAINIVPKVITKTDAASGAAVSGALATAGSIVTGGAITPLTVLGATAVGGLAGSTNKTVISTEEVRTCSFRITVDGIPLVYYGDSKELYTTTAAAAFRKCTMLNVGDIVIPTLTCAERSRYYPGGLKTYMWTSGHTVGFLY